MIASVGASMRGSGTVSTATLRRPCQVTAFIRALLRSGSITVPVLPGGLAPKRPPPGLPAPPSGRWRLPFHYGYRDRGDGTHDRAANELTTDVDPASKQPLFKTAAARIRRAP
ncbi:hypothetical protein IFM12275_17290 [Nocardia sputorum]|nr:hypothetical protein IFM12275_17290 [Nocardia sputorum]